MNRILSFNYFLQNYLIFSTLLFSQNNIELNSYFSTEDIHFRQRNKILNRSHLSSGLNLSFHANYISNSGHPNIDTNHAGITGWRLGGGVSLYSAWLPLINAINGGKFMFAAHLPIYPPCMAYPYPKENMQFSVAPIHILIGELDNWVPAAACTELIDKMYESELPINIDITIYTFWVFFGGFCYLFSIFELVFLPLI